MKYVCVRVYPSKTIKFAVRDLEGMRSWVRYNKRHRGNSLFVNGRRVKNTMESPVNISVIKKITTHVSTHYVPIRPLMFL
jgi:hypothetical protein